MAISDILPIVRLDRKTIGRVSKNKLETKRAHILLLVSAIISAALSIALDMLLSNDVWVDVTPGLRVAAVVLYVVLLAPLFSVISLWVMTGLFHLAAKLLGGTGGYMALLRPIAHSSAGLGLLSWIPFVNIASAIWSLVVNVVAISVVERLSTGRAVGALAMAIFVVAAFALVVAIVVGVFLAMNIGTLTPTL